MPILLNMDLRQLGERVTRLRKERQLSQQKLAELADMSLSAVRRLEYGDQKQPSIVHVAKAAQALGVTLDGLVSGLAQPDADHAEPEAVERFRRRPLGVSATPQEMRLILAAAAAAPGVATVAFLEAVLALSRGLISPDEMGGAVSLSEAIDSGKWQPK